METSLSTLRVFMGECGFASRESGIEAIATNGLISCIGFSGYNFSSSSGFVAHFSTPEQVKDFYSRGVEVIKAADSKMVKFHCKIIGGYARAKFSREIVSSIKENLEGLEDLFFVIEEEEPFLQLPIERSLLLNLKTGERASYIPSPGHRALTEEEEKRYRKLESLERLYFVGSVL